MSTATQTRMTADEFIRAHGDEPGVELADGVIRRIPMPGSEHGEVCFRAALILGNHVVPNRLGRIMTNDTFIRMSETHCFGADVCFVSYDTLPADRPTPKGPLAPPLELVVEVRSPSNTVPEMTDKANEYLRAGVQVVLILDPQTDTAGVFRLNELPQRFSNGDLVVLPEVSPTFAVPASKFFE